VAEAYAAKPAQLRNFKDTFEVLSKQLRSEQGHRPKGSNIEEWRAARLQEAGWQEQAHIVLAAQATTGMA
jgi:hypothetical protein